MSRSYPAGHHPTRRGPPFTPHVLAVAGLVTFCIAVLALVTDLSAGLTVMNVAVSGVAPTFDGGMLVLSDGLLLISAASMFFGVLLLFLRL